jgi:carbonyl reductase 1
MLIYEFRDLSNLLNFRRKFQNKGILINACCPGYVQTDMTKHNPMAQKMPKDGAVTPLKLALLPFGEHYPQGKFILDA